MSRIQDKAIQVMLEYVYEHDTSIKGWDCSFIESLYDQYFSKGGLTENQIKALERRYESISSPKSQRLSYE